MSLSAPTRLRKLITNHYSLDEFRTLCFDLGVRYDDLGGDGGIAAVGEQIVDVGRIGVEGSGRVWYGSGRHVKTSGRGVDVFAAPVVVEAGSGFFDCGQCNRPFDRCQVGRMNC